MNDCIVFKGYYNKVTGYGYLSSKGVNAYPHRLAYQLYKGKIPKGFVIDHICRNRRCINPEHLRAVTQQVNAMENNVGVAPLNAKKTHCPKDHPLEKDNLVLHKDVKGKYHRECKTCISLNNKKYYLKKKSIIK